MFYLNVVGYKEWRHRQKAESQPFYLNVVGYKDIKAGQTFKNYKEVLSERSGI